MVNMCQRKSHHCQYWARCVIASANSLVGRHLTIRLDSMFQAEQLPAGVANLHATLGMRRCHGCSGRFQIAQLKRICTGHCQPSHSRNLGKSNFPNSGDAMGCKISLQFTLRRLLNAYLHKLLESQSASVTALKSLCASQLIGARRSAQITPREILCGSYSEQNSARETLRKLLRA